MYSTGQTSALPAPAAFSVRAHLQLMRPANMVTAMADVLAGFAVAGLMGVEKLPWLLVSALALYGGGVTMNDFFDRRLDAVERPERPIPSGRATALSAGLLGCGLLALGIAFAFQSSAASGAIAIAVAALAVLYDAAGKHVAFVGPVLMGSCRGLDLLLGMSANPAVLPVRWYAAIVSLIYIAGVTLLSTGEVHGGTRAKSWLSSTLLAAAAIGAMLMASASTVRLAGAALMVALLAWRVGPAFYKACAQPGAAEIRSAIKAGVMSLVFLDAAIAAAYVSLWYALGLVGLILLVSRLARLFPVT
jgi:4-hydroxybenzoate polyprenyltransferase